MQENRYEETKLSDEDIQKIIENRVNWYTKMDASNYLLKWVLDWSRLVEWQQSCSEPEMADMRELQK